MWGWLIQEIFGLGELSFQSVSPNYLSHLENQFVDALATLALMLKMSNRIKSYPRLVLNLETNLPTFTISR